MVVCVVLEGQVAIMRNCVHFVITPSVRIVSVSHCRHEWAIGNKVCVCVCTFALRLVKASSLHSLAQCLFMLGVGAKLQSCENHSQNSVLCEGLSPRSR